MNPQDLTNQASNIIPEKSAAARTAFLTSIGPLVDDIRPAPKSSGADVDQKQDSLIEESLGGGAYNTALQVTNFGIGVRPIFLIGPDARGKMLAEQALQNMAEAIVLPWLTRTRLSILHEGGCETIRPSLATSRPAIPGGVVQTINGARIVLIGPLTTYDYEFARQVLDLARTAILQFSEQQLMDRDLSCDLARRAWLTVLNDRELRLWMGTTDIHEGLRRLRQRGVKNALVTSRKGVQAVIDGESYSVPAFAIKSATNKTKAGDRFLGTFAACIAEGRKPQKAIAHGLAAAALHVEGHKGASDPQEIAKAVAERRTVTLPVRPGAQGRHAGTGAARILMASAASLLVGWAAGTGWSWFI